MKIIITMALAATLAACATDPSRISAMYISPITYNSLDCAQLGAEAQRVSQQVQILTGRTQQEATKDALVTAVGVVVFWPALFFIGGNGPSQTELAQMKGQMNAIEQASVAKHCNITFRRS